MVRIRCHAGIKFSIVAIFLELTFLLIFGFLVEYYPCADARVTGNVTGKLRNSDLVGINANPVRTINPFFQDVQGMMFLGFGFLMTFLYRYSFSSLGINFFLSVLVIQWALIIHGAFHLEHGKILISNESFLNAEFTVAGVLISFGAVLGKTSPLQMMIFAVIEVVVLSVNEYIGRKLFLVNDMGDSIFVHTFGAYFGLFVSLVITRKDMHEHEKEKSIYHSDLFAMLGTLILWIYWPSFNSAGAPGASQHRAVMNTVLGLCGSTFITFAIAGLLPPPPGYADVRGIVEKNQGKFYMVYIQNAVLAGGVAVGACADLMIHPWGALLLGVIGGTISTLGYRYLTPKLNSIRFHDTCGVHNLHGMPGVLGALASSAACGMATYKLYGENLYQTFPAMVPKQSTEFYYTVKYGGMFTIAANEGLGRTASIQACYQLAALFLTLLLAAVGGVITGAILLIPCLNAPKESLYDDRKFWLLPDDQKFLGNQDEYHTHNDQFHVVTTSPLGNNELHMSTLTTNPNIHRASIVSQTILEQPNESGLVNGLIYRIEPTVEPAPITHNTRNRGHKHKEMHEIILSAPVITHNTRTHGISISEDSTSAEGAANYGFNSPEETVYRSG